jgi:4-amino-4-deoxy-L-arabinose transferase-like glycosyltransferase
MGGRRIGPIVAALAVFSAGVYWGLDHILTMNTIEQLLWGACALVVVKIVNGADHKWWLAFGVLSGIGILNKYSMVFFGFAIVVGVLLTPLRNSLLSKWFWIAGAIAGLMALPNFLWQMHHGFPFLELMENIKKSGRDVALPPLAFIKQQIMMLNPAVAPVWITGLIWLFIGKEGRKYRVLGVSFLVVFALMMALHGKDYYLAPAYVMLLSAGAVAFEIGWQRLPVRVAVVAACLLMVVSWVTMPLGIPLMSPERFIAYKKALGLDLKESENHRQNELGQYYADHFGWPEMTEQVAKAYNRIPPELRKKTAIKTDNYGEAGAIDHFGKKYGLPLAISGHQNYWMWGPGEFTGESLLLLGEGEPETLTNKCAQVTAMGQVGTKWSIPYEHFTIYWCRGLKAPLKDIWPQVKNWN